MRTHTTTLGTGINPTPEFARKGLAEFAVNVGTKCSHDCLYCSSGSLMRMDKSFKAAKESPFDFGYCIVDPDTPERVARDACRLRSRGMIQLCTIVDAWAPEAQKHKLGRRCLEAILAESDWTVRILTKNAAVAADYDLIEKHHDRVLVGLSLTATPAKQPQLSVIERNASPVADRMSALKEAHDRGLRTFGMLCPLLPGLADDPATISELASFSLSCGAEEIFAEPVNARGPGLPLVEQALEKSGFLQEAAAIHRIRKRTAWSEYCAELIHAVQEALNRFNALEKLRFLLYPANLQKKDLLKIRRNDQGIQWLGSN